MLANTARDTGDSSCSWAMAATIPDPAVMAATPSPMSTVSCDGFSFGLDDMARKLQPASRHRRTSVGDGSSPRVGLSEAGGHGAEDLVGQAGDLVQDAAELALTEHEQRHVGVGLDGGRPGTAVEQRHLPEVLTGAQRGDLATASLDRRGAVHDQEELMPRRALFDEDLPGR